jgi:hypothetical protein
MVETLCPALNIRKLVKIVRVSDDGKQLWLEGVVVPVPVDRTGVSPHGYFIVTAHYPRS